MQTADIAGGYGNHRGSQSRLSLCLCASVVRGLEDKTMDTNEGAEELDTPVREWTEVREAAGRGGTSPPVPLSVDGEEERRTAGHALEVTVIRPGRSGNGLHYSEAVLRAAAPLWEGAAAFCDHPTALDETRAGGRSVRDLVGVYADARYDDGIRATLRLYPNAEWLFRLLASALADREAGRPAPNIGISADMRVLKERTADGWEVRRITKVNSGDVVFQPAAGGRFERVVEGGGSRHPEPFAVAQDRLRERSPDSSVVPLQGDFPQSL
jgi:hypothetical protein